MIKLSQATLGQEEQDAIARVFTQHKYLGMGQEVKLFEEELTAYIGMPDRHVVTVNTGTSALHLAVQACGIGPGDEVIIPSVTYVASFQAVSATGAKPVACDVNPVTGFMDPDDVRRRITPQTKALMPVHYASGTEGLAEVYAIAQAHNLRVIEDAAHAFGGTYQGRPVGAIGDVLCFSFDGIKNITCGEGGAVVTGDVAVAAKIKDLRLLAVHKDSDQRFSGQRSWDFDVIDQGWRYHMSNINAAIGRAQLKKVAGFVDLRRALARQYRTLLKAPVQPIMVDLTTVAPHIFPILVPAEQRDAFQEYLKAHEIETGLHYKPNHLLSRYRGTGCPNAEVMWAQMLTLPLHCNMTLADVDHIATAVNTFFKGD